MSAFLGVESAISWISRTVGSKPANGLRRQVPIGHWMAWLDDWNVTIPSGQRCMHKNIVFEVYEKSLFTRHEIVRLANHIIELTLSDAFEDYGTWKEVVVAKADQKNTDFMFPCPRAYDHG